ncbi:5-oxoprolinase subunit PxpB [Aneurinibacillus thermoaerophilus]|uniref:Inhibitor of KinA n=1 Tax=Aneurinibacillus thermoaerophilus TaxID=143495 RepID=A0A1G8CA76_ANETH|nr:5-oxoprolinase subunit PxpB [Aneurinibacillus thermoaerophilus]MED0681184.1 5-oxoprolinase subunit PxpB [Aneurinibacillus thermoaerophilus]MED0757326.1 5-oxoprolinase subunit PxpB [Aneurinibacillus thermoaerophilus]MED0761457.1 5-oxoprolinase subunit PxpB [Aneurinibacillus thermoaerophilus]MED0765126.1 5-oxoprolinase subunit PxpB [Aneurinibacillus thermoaerophilus]SDH42374.1 inhibitor of KinA [Aneurinibacillus thermoaerophilus]
MKLFPLGDAAIVVELGSVINEETHCKVRALSEYLTRHPLPGMIEYIPAFTTVTVFYDPCRVLANSGAETKTFVSPYQKMRAMLENILSELQDKTVEKTRVIEIPVCYGGEFGPDLGFVAEHNGLTPEDVIRIHSSAEYLVYMIGFAPGFPYLGGMPEQIATPRRSSPRLSIPVGSVGIAGKQTGVYPIATPGGWQLIGRTPLPLFMPDSDPPTPLKAGDRIRFRAISRQEYDEWKERGACG